MDRNSNLEHLWDYAMPSKDRYKRSLLYKPSNVKVPSRADGGIASTPVTATPVVEPEVQQGEEEFKTYLPTHKLTQDQARLYAYKQKLDAALASKNPETWKKIQGWYSEDTPIAERIAKAQGYIQDKTYPYSLKEEEMKSLLGEDYEDFNTLRQERSKLWGLDVAGVEEQGKSTPQTEYGLRNSWSIPNPRYSRPITVKGEKREEIEGRTTYDPSKKVYQYSYITKPLTIPTLKKKGGLLRVNPKQSKKEEMTQDSIDKDKSSLRKPNAVPGSVNKSRSHRQ